MLTGFLLHIQSGKSARPVDVACINWKELEATAEGQAFLDLTQDLGLIQHVETATRHGNVLDFVLTTTPNLVRNVPVTEPFGSSDHNMVEFTIVCKTEYISLEKRIL